MIQSNKYFISVDSCELCAEEYVHEAMDKVKGHPNDEKKSAKLSKAIIEAQKASTKTCVRFLCRESLHDSVAYHNLCADHLYKLIDAIKEHEEETAEDQ